MEVRAGFLLLLVIDEYYSLNGFSVFVLSDIDRFRRLDEKEDMINYVLSRRYGSEYLREHRHAFNRYKRFAFLSEIHQYAPLLTVFREHRDSTVCNVGRILAIEKEKVELREISADGIWEEGLGRFKLDDITRIDFGGQYEDALWRYGNRETDADLEGV